jgi:hypothetical protein
VSGVAGNSKYDSAAAGLQQEVQAWNEEKCFDETGAYADRMSSHGFRKNFLGFPSE